MSQQFHPSANKMPILGGPILQPLRAIIFDIGRVIVRVDLERSFEAYGKHDGLSAEQVWTALQTDARWNDWQEGRMAPQDWHKHLCEKFKLYLSFEEFCETWNRVLDPVTILPESLFERLSANCRLALLSNTDPIHAAHIEATFPFVRHFPVRVYSCRIGACKPGAMIYHHTLREVDALPEETLFVDDLRENVTGALSLGMTGFHFTSPGELLSEFTRLGL
jgi:putative hydrolase of the HAD superfamily